MPLSMVKRHTRGLLNLEIKNTKNEEVNLGAATKCTVFIILQRYYLVYGYRSQ